MEGRGETGWELGRIGARGGVREAGSWTPSPPSLKYCQTCIVKPLLTDVLRFCVTRWVGVVSNCTVGLFFGRYRFFYWFFRSCFVNIENSSSSAVPKWNWT